jgi:tetratricopeptide (TPR) repeat protein
MDLTDCYQLLGLEPGASLAEIKVSYRHLARQYHPDINPSDQKAKDKFIALTEAYKLLLRSVHPTETNDQELDRTEPVGHQYTEVQGQQPPVTKVTRKQKPTRNTPPLSQVEQQLKWRSYQQLQQLLREERFPSAIALVEGLAKRLPQDLEVCQWQASVYQRWGRQLLNERQLDKARSYLKKALKTDPHNRSLWSEVERDFRRMEKFF